MKTSRKYIKKNMAKSKKRFSKRGGGPFDFLLNMKPLDKKAEEVNPNEKKTEEEVNPDEKKTEEEVNPDEKKTEEEVNPDETPKPKEESTLEEVNLDEIKPEEGVPATAEEGEKPDVSSSEIFMTDKISTQPCNDSNYKEIGIIHLSDSMALNMLRNAATGVFNVFGQKGFDNSIYDQLRNGCFTKMNDLLKDGQRVCNLRVDIERDEALIYMHLYGTLLEKMESELSEKESVEQSVENSLAESNPQNEEVESLQNDLEETNLQSTEGEHVEKDNLTK
jgi:hypothetical protein